MIPLIQTEMQNSGWLDNKEFADIVSISQMTPGPVGINAATYVGYKTAGIAGSICATLGVFIPSFILIVIASIFLEKFRENRFLAAVFMGIRPATIGLISVAVLFFAQISIFLLPLGLENVGRYALGKAAVNSFSFKLDFRGIIIFLLILLGTKYVNLSAIYAIILSAILGIMLF